MNWAIRPFDPDDYAAIHALYSEVYPENPSTVEELRFKDESRDERCQLRRWVAQRGGAVVGVGEYNQFRWNFHPDQFQIHVAVRPARRELGIGGRLYEEILAGLAPLAPRLLRAETREHLESGIAFLERRGFEEEMREWESLLDVERFEIDAYRGLLEKVERKGYALRSLSELEQEDPDCYRKLYRLDRAVREEVPKPHEFTPSDYDAWLDEFLEHPHLLKSGYLVAVHAGDYVGLSTFRKDPSSSTNDLYTDLTGVRADHRRQGLALALKVAGIRYAKRQGHRWIKTWNESNNEGILALNRRLGFVKQPAWISYIKPLIVEGGA